MKDHFVTAFKNIELKMNEVIEACGIYQKIAI